MKNFGEFYNNQIETATTIILSRTDSISQQKLAEISGVSRATISGLECGVITVTTTDTLIKIATALGRKVSDIFLE